MEYAALIVSALLENEDDIDLDVRDVVRGGMYRMWWEWNDSHDESQQIVEDPPVPYADMDERPKPRLFLRIKSTIPKFDGYMSFDFYKPNDYDPDESSGSIHVTITNDIGWGTTYAEASARHFTLPLKDWTTLKRLCEGFLRDTVRQMFQGKEGSDPKTGKKLSAQALKFKVKARFRKLMDTLQQHQLSVQNTPEMKALRQAQSDFEKEFQATKDNYEDRFTEDPEAEGLPTDWKKMTLADIAKWRSVLKRYSKATGENPGASSVPPPPMA